MVVSNARCYGVPEGTMASACVADGCFAPPAQRRDVGSYDGGPAMSSGVDDAPTGLPPPSLPSYPGALQQAFLFFRISPLCLVAVNNMLLSSLTRGRARVFSRAPAVHVTYWYDDERRAQSHSRFCTQSDRTFKVGPSEIAKRGAQTLLSLSPFALASPPSANCAAATKVTAGKHCTINILNKK